LEGTGNCITSAKEEIVENSSLLIFPNPVADVLNVELKNDWQGELTLDVVNIFGQEVYFGNVFKPAGAARWEIDLSSLASGVYQIMLLDGERMVVQAFVKQ